MTQLAFQPVYLCDGCCIIRLDGKDRMPPAPPDFTPQERALIWDGLERLTGAGRLKLISQVKEELSRWHPEGLKRLVPYPGHRVNLPRSPANILLWRQVVSRYPDIGPRPGKDPADPWLIVAAQKFRYPIVTMELALSERSPRANKKLRIPDICALEGMPLPMNLRQLAVVEGWLPQPTPGPPRILDAKETSSS